MRFTCSQIKFLSPEHFRILLAIELGSKNHESVPLSLIQSISKAKCNLDSIITDLVKQKFIKGIPYTGYEGYALTYTGYDNLALYALQKEGKLWGVGGKIGVGKESDLYLGMSPEKKLVCIKIHRLGRVCFKTVKLNRDYHQNRKYTSWMYLSRLSAEKEFEHMTRLWGKIPIPRPISQNRHVVVMEYLENYTTLCKIPKTGNTLPRQLKPTLLKILEDMAELGYAHGDFNEFNIMIRNDYQKVKIIDFPQMVPIDDPRGPEYRERDRTGLDAYFKEFS
ncbi:RIO kinase 2 [Nematocida homosporus]|uniref:RIO kinase 2 n=1 Tax=Nematocida homosporus TaxID=1912981 RepID=UPI00221ECC23|nr:RIO kinase 2 [Nematocida homosporus]KAI5187354.1 RIO kinase 2 [Nematocida homosporus]